MKQIVITAGGTIEKIDAVRSITNTSTGQLGSLICEEILKYLVPREDYKIHYILSNTAERPKSISNKIQFYEVTDTQSVIDTVTKICQNHKVHYFIHSMAVSDFTTAYTVQIEDVAKEIIASVSNTSICEIEERVKHILEEPKYKLENNKKISSQSDVLVGLRKTPKVISLIKKFDKDVFLVGFKLVNQVSEKRLIEIATKLGEENECDLVLANDIKDIASFNHKAILLEKGIVIDRFYTKSEIAKGLVGKMFGSVEE